MQKLKTAPFSDYSEVRLPAIAALCAAVLYLGFPAARYNFDGVACAIAVELGDLRHLVHGNHLAYGYLGYLWFSLWKLFGYHGPALQSLQVMSSLLGAGAVGAFALFLVRCEISSALAVLGAFGLMISHDYWIWSLEAQVYPLGAFFIFLTAAEAVKKMPDARRLGILHGCAVLGHVGHLMFLPAVFYLLKTDSRKKWLYGVSFIIVIIAAYFAAGLFCVRPSSWRDLQVWLLGSAALNVERSFQWHGGYSIQGLRDWVRVSLELWGGNIFIGFAALALAVRGAFVSLPSRRRIVSLCLIWIAGYAALFLAWEPHTPVYRITDLAPLWLLMLAGIEKFKTPNTFKTSAMALGVLALGAWNLRSSILPAGDPLRNGDLQRALWIGEQTPENAWVVAGGTGEVYFPYFAHRKPLSLHYYSGREELLDARLKDLSLQGEPVFVIPQMLPADWRGWFLSRPLKEKAQRSGETLFEIAGVPIKK